MLRYAKSFVFFNSIYVHILFRKMRYLVCLPSLVQCTIVLCMDIVGFEIPDVDADRLLRPTDFVQYIADKQDVYD